MKPAALVAVLLLAAAARAGEAGPGSSFRKVQLTDQFWSEGVAVADVNGDGHPDIIAGPYWYEGPSFSRRHEIFPATQTYRRRKADGAMETVPGYEGARGTANAYSNAFLEFAWDFNGDGRPDVLIVGFPGQEADWYENPGPGSRRPWTRHEAFGAVSNESPAFVDLFRDGHPVLVCMTGDQLGYLRPNPAAPGELWKFHAISPPLPLLRALHRADGKPFPFAHGLGVGDLLGNGRGDILDAQGWWEQPASARGGSPWKFHRWSFLRARPPAIDAAVAAGTLTRQAEASLWPYCQWPYALGGAQIRVCDVNGDGRPDVISSLNAHGYGLAWFEQLPRPDPAAEIAFRPHFILGPGPAPDRHGVEFSELHAVELADIAGHGRVDIVTGKRYWAHGPNGPDPESDAPAVLYWFQLVRGPGGSVDYAPHRIDCDSGIGTQFTTADLLGNGRTDIITANKKGVFVFLRQ